MCTRRLFPRRDGSLALETVMLLPVAVATMLAAAFIAEGMIFRTDVTASVRGGTAAAASGGACLTPDRDFAARDGTRRGLTLGCRPIDDERGLRSAPPLFDDLRRAARDWPDLPAQVAPRGPVEGILGQGAGTLALTEPPFLQRMGRLENGTAHRLPRTERWDHGGAPWRAGYDPTIWRELSKRGTAQLFPRVFPARDG